ncbi:hypothetical protein NS226_17800 [Aureimonas ureilytica]|uniref:Uncharacterized protein n=2 Tax=Aureimonas ureilytica TaxID=401562 RepID=A0A175R4T8_9HYPH|nr:hypothetical protein NS226_17800 [Aureimonas ureilytica]
MTGKTHASKSVKLQAELRSLEAAHQREIEALEVAQAAYSEDPSEATLAERQRLQIARDRAELNLRRKRDEIEAAIAVETDPANRALYDETARERHEVEVWLRKRYTALAAEIAEGLERLVAVELASRQANGRLPSGAEPFGDLEFEIRRGPHASSGELRWTVRLPALELGTLNHWPADEIG